jgi:LPXTG-motif cell wall-anchored protein
MNASLREVNTIVLFLIIMVSAIFTYPNPLSAYALSDEDLIKDTLRNYYNAFNAHQTDVHLKLITSDAVKQWCGGQQGYPTDKWTGSSQIKEQLQAVFKDAKLLLGPEIYITKLDIAESIAKIQTTYLGSGTGFTPYWLTENLNLVKQGDIWLVSFINVCSGKVAGGKLLPLEVPTETPSPTATPTPTSTPTPSPTPTQTPTPTPTTATTTMETVKPTIPPTTQQTGLDTNTLAIILAVVIVAIAGIFLIKRKKK